MEVGEGSDSSWTLKMEPKGLTEISAVEDERERGVGPTAEFRGRRKGAASHFPGWGCLGQEGSGAAGARKDFKGKFHLSKDCKEVEACQVDRQHSYVLNN